jgi:hypothetical protein
LSKQNNEAYRNSYESKFIQNKNNKYDSHKISSEETSALFRHHKSKSAISEKTEAIKSIFKLPDKQ